QVGAVDTTVADGVADLFLVAIRLRGVQVPVTSAEGRKGASVGVLASDLPRAEAEKRHTRATGKNCSLGRKGGGRRRCNHGNTVAMAGRQQANPLGLQDRQLDGGWAIGAAQDLVMVAGRRVPREERMGRGRDLQPDPVA